VVCVRAKSICSSFGLAFGMLSSSPPPVFLRVFFTNLYLAKFSGFSKGCTAIAFSRLPLPYDTFKAQGIEGGGSLFFRQLPVGIFFPFFRCDSEKCIADRQLASSMHILIITPV
jgi:hypothetical protein